MDYRSSRLPPPVWKRSALVCWPAIWGQIDQFISFRATPRLSWAGRSPKKICVCCLRNTSPPCARCSRKVHTVWAACVRESRSPKGWFAIWKHKDRWSAYSQSSTPGCFSIVSECGCGGLSIFSGVEGIQKHESPASNGDLAAIQWYPKGNVGQLVSGAKWSVPRVLGSWFHDRPVSG